MQWWAIALANLQILGRSRVYFEETGDRREKGGYERAIAIGEKGDRFYLKTYTPVAKNCSAVKFNSGKAKEIMRLLCEERGDRGKKGGRSHFLGKVRAIAGLKNCKGDCMYV